MKPTWEISVCNTCVDAHLGHASTGVSIPQPLGLIAWADRMSLGGIHAEPCEAVDYDDCVCDALGYLYSTCGSCGSDIPGERTLATVIPDWRERTLAKTRETLAWARAMRLSGNRLEALQALEEAAFTRAGIND